MLSLFKNFTIYLKKNSLFKGVFTAGGELTLITTNKNLYNALLILKKKTQFQLTQLIDIFVCDHPEHENRFSISYSVLSITMNSRTVVKLSTSTLQPLTSITSLFSAANWLEKEIWDMFGIFFFFNLNLSRLLTDYGFKGHPLRKDFPLTGYFELFYNDFVKSIVFTKVSLAQDYRCFSFHFLHTAL